jgi:gluconate 5-dehydrogenase
VTTSLFNLTGKIALVTGSSRGIGLALARGLAEAGASVIVHSRDPGAAEAVTGELRVSGHQAWACAFDVTDADQVTRAIARCEADFGPIDILINNAGIQHRAPLLDLAEADWRRVMDTNLDAVFRVGREVARSMVQRGRGRIVNIASLMSQAARPGVAPYAAAKGGLKMLTQSMCVEWARHGLQVNAIGPGYFATDLTADLAADPQFDQWIKARTPAGRWGRVEELVGAAVFLASDAASFVNGQVIYVDGGVLAGL